MIEKHLERVFSMFGDADDQHVVIIAQEAASVGNRAPPRGEGASRGARPLRATTTAAGSSRDARAAQNQMVLFQARPST